MLFDFPVTAPEQLEIALSVLGAKNGKGFRIEPAKSDSDYVGEMLVPDETESGMRMKRLIPSDSGWQTVSGEMWTAANLNESQIRFSELRSRIEEMVIRWRGSPAEVVQREADISVKMAAEMGRERAAMQTTTVPDSLKQ
jgi:hypothetical protein